MSLLTVNNLNLYFTINKTLIQVLDNLSFTLQKGEILGIVGESGSGKSQTVLSIMGLLDANAQVTGSVRFGQHDLLHMRPQELNKLRGNEISMIFQDTMTALNPYLTIESQLSEVLRLHKGLSKASAIAESIRMLDFVKLSDVTNKIKLYPHEFSGGMLQRVMIAMALLCKPSLLIADEPTTALDVTVQAQILQLFSELRDEFDMSIILITHDMGVVANICDQVNVMYAGKLMESGTVEQIFYSPQHPYTQALLNSIPHMEIQQQELYTITGEPPNIRYLPVGCAFQERCLKVHDQCRVSNITTHTINDRRVVKCNLF